VVSAARSTGLEKIWAGHGGFRLAEPGTTANRSSDQYVPGRNAGPGKPNAGSGGGDTIHPAGGWRRKWIFWSAMTQRPMIPRMQNWTLVRGPSRTVFAAPEMRSFPPMSNFQVPKHGRRIDTVCRRAKRQRRIRSGGGWKIACDPVHPETQLCGGAGTGSRPAVRSGICRRQLFQSWARVVLGANRSGSASACIWFGNRERSTALRRRSFCNQSGPKCCAALAGNEQRSGAKRAAVERTDSGQI